MTDVLSQAIESKSYSHAYLFTGPHGVGKTSTARILAHHITELPYDGTQHIDIIELDAASNRRIDEIRALLDTIHIAPIQSKKKVYIIDEVHMLTKEAFNALLKTIEEPPEHVVVIMATTERHKVPATILSRAQQHNFKRFDTEMLADHLLAVAKKEKIQLDKKSAELIAGQAAGSARDALSILDSVKSSGREVSYDELTKRLAVSPEDVRSIVELVRTGELQKISGAIDMLRKNGFSSQETIELLSSELRDAALDSSSPSSLIDLANDVLKATGSRNPLLAVELALLQHAAAGQQAAQPEDVQPSTDKNVTAEPAKGTETTVVKSKKVAKPPEAPTEATPHVEKAASDNEITSKKEATTGIWKSILAEIEKKYLPLFSTVKLATSEVKGDILEISVPYEFHKKKVEKPESKTKILNCAQSVDRSIQSIRVILGSKKAASSELDQIKSLIGGGEVVALGE